MEFLNRHLTRILLIAAGMIFLFISVRCVISDEKIKSSPKKTSATKDTEKDSGAPADSTKIPTHNSNGGSLRQNSGPKPGAHAIPYSSLSAEQKSLRTMIGVFKETIRSTEYDTFVRRLENLRVGPQVYVDKQSDAGEMRIIRARYPLSGTRYLHAQFFTDENGQPHLQHLSFEFRPGDNAFANAVAEVQSQIVNGAPDIAIPDAYAKWDLADAGYILWIKTMTLEDLEDDPFNSYTSDDVGTVRVVLEEEIH